MHVVIARRPSQQNTSSHATCQTLNKSITMFTFHPSMYLNTPKSIEIRENQSIYKYNSIKILHTWPTHSSPYTCPIHPPSLPKVFCNSKFSSDKTSSVVALYFKGQISYCLQLRSNNNNNNNNTTRVFIWSQFA